MKKNVLQDLHICIRVPLTLETLKDEKDSNKKEEINLIFTTIT